MTLDFSSMRMPTLKIEKFIYMADGFYVYKMEDGYAVKDQFGYTLKSLAIIALDSRILPIFKLSNEIGSENAPMLKFLLTFSTTEVVNSKFA